MHLRRAAVAGALAVVASGCRESAAPAKPTPANLELMSSPTASSIAGASAGSMVVKVSDASGAPLSGAVVTFTVSFGGGRVSRDADATKGDGTASTEFTLGTMPGSNQVAAAVPGVSPVKSTPINATAGPSQTISVGPRVIRFSATQDSSNVTATPRDTFGNSTGSAVTWISRNEVLVSVAPGSGNAGIVRVLSRPGQTYLVATSGAASDSVSVSVRDASSTACTFVASPTTIAVGGSVAFENGGAVCVRSADAGAEYALVSHFNTAVSSATTVVEVTGTGIEAPAASITGPASARITGDGLVGHDVSFERALRDRERREIGAHVPRARAWQATRGAALSAPPREGDVATFNVNAFEFCGSPKMRAARVVAITSSAIIMADTSNPAGGFTDAEYRSFGAAMDTLVSPVDTAAFGAPSDIDRNGRVVILFTRGVNEITPRGSGGGVVLGFFYNRDLLPRQGSFGSCPGSNMSEMFYLLVPDPDGIAADSRSKTFVESVTVGIIAHEYQHLINASRRMYVTGAPNVNEEVWLNEGLSHIAEELVFYRASQLGPGQNIGASSLQSGTHTRAMFDTYQRGNFGRYMLFLRAPDSNSPLAPNDALAIRGATWAFLRYLADRPGVNEGDLWYDLVNSQLTGAANVDEALGGTGVTTLGALRDWAVSVFADDNTPGSSSAFQQPSWNFVTGLPEVGFTYGLNAPNLVNRAVSILAVRAAASSYVRFAVAQSQEALLQVTGRGGSSLPPGMRLTLVRIR